MPKFHCNHCGQRIEVREVYAGHSFTCPTCNGQLRVPEAADPTPKNLSKTRKFSSADFYFSFNGRISVVDYWIKGFLIPFVLSLLVLMVDIALGASDFIYVGCVIVAIWTGAALIVKRSHNWDKSGWHYWILLITVIRSIWTLIKEGCMEDTKGDDRYGQDPVGRSI